MLRTLILVLASLATSLAAAETTDVIRETEGYGATQQEAVTNALVEAVRQVRGTAAGVERSVKESMAVIAGAGHAALLEKSTAPVQEVYTESRGYVRNYQVLDITRAGDVFYARIRAEVPVHESVVKENGRPRIAVLPFRVSLDGYTLADHGSAVTFSQRLADKLLTRLSEDPSIVLVMRDFFAELGLEKAVLERDAAPEELTKLGAAVGADLLLVGRVQEARTEHEAGAYGGSPKITDEVRLSWRLIEAATGKLVRAGDVALDAKRPPAKNSYGSKTRNDFEASALFSALAQKVSEAALVKDPAQSEAASTSPGSPVELTPGSSDKPLQW